MHTTADRTWQGSFIWKPTPKEELYSSENEMVFFRKSFHCTNPGGKCLLSVSADSRYRLYVNGKPLLSGPCKGSEFVWYYETIEIQNYLIRGKNTIAVAVLHHPPRGENISVWRSPLGMLICDVEWIAADGTISDTISTDTSWVCCKDTSVSFLPGSYNTMFLGGSEQVAGEMRLDYWQYPDFDDSKWEHSVPYSLVDTSTGVLEPWQLTPRPIPFLFEKHRDFEKLMYSYSSSEGEAFDEKKFFTVISPSHAEAFEIFPHTNIIVEIDAGELTTGYPVFSFSKGKGSSIQILYAECYEFEPIEIPWERNKGLRDDPAQGKLYGDTSCYRLSGRGTSELPEMYEPFWFKAFRFIRLEIEVLDEPLHIEAMYYRETGYPLEVEATFACSDTSFQELWNISLNTLQRCMHESYEDCPYYEQYQYAMDTYLQTLFTYQVSGDDRLARKAIHDFHCSLLPQGLLQSRFPSIEYQIIPGFNIFWILMVHDHFLYFQDDFIIKRYSATIDAILNWFDRHLDEHNLVSSIPKQYWQFVDWVPEWRAGRGVPVAAQYGPLTVYSLMYVVGLQKAAALQKIIGRRGMAEEYEIRAEKILNAVKTHCWSKEHQLFTDGPQLALFSQHTQIWAVLSGAIFGKPASELMNSVVSEEIISSYKLARVSYAMSFFLFRALSMTNLYDNTTQLWDPWFHMISCHVTTWNEDPVTQRSDCHAWGAVPLYELGAEILGVHPAALNTSEILIKPQPGKLLWARGSVCTKGGTINVSWKQHQNSFSLTVINPAKIPFTVIFPDGKKTALLRDEYITLESPKE